VTAAADDNIWVWANGTVNGTITVWLAHWDGAAWTVMPDDITRHDPVAAIVAISPTRAYAVEKNTIARWNGRS
jgi:hypothetical protein